MDYADRINALLDTRRSIENEMADLPGRRMPGPLGGAGAMDADTAHRYDCLADAEREIRKAIQHLQDTAYPPSVRRDFG